MLPPQTEPGNLGQAIFVFVRPDILDDELNDEEEPSKCKGADAELENDETSSDFEKPDADYPTHDPDDVNSVVPESIQTDVYMQAYWSDLQSQSEVYDRYVLRHQNCIWFVLCISVGTVMAVALLAIVIMTLLLVAKVI